MGRVAGVVLTGGAGRRMGGDKPLVAFRGRPLAQWVVDALRDGGCDPVVTVGGDPGALEVLGVRNIADRFPGEGPLAGVVAATEALLADSDAARFVLVAACDLGWLDAETVTGLRSADAEADLVVARGGRLHPSLARYSHRAAAFVRERFDTGERAMYRLVAAAQDPGSRLRVVEHEIDERRLANINTPGDLD